MLEGLIKVLGEVGLLALQVGEVGCAFDDALVEMGDACSSEEIVPSGFR